MHWPDSTRWTVVLGAAACRDADRDSFCRQYGPVIRAYLAARWRLPSDHERVLDATQEVFLDCLKPNGALSRVDSERATGFRAYLYGVVSNVAAVTERRYARQRERQARGNVDLDTLAPAEPTLSRVFDRAWAELLLTEAYDLMSKRAGTDPRGERCITALKLRFREAMPPRDIAERLQAPIDDVYQLLKTGKRRFRAALLTAMATYHPNASEQELERRCMDLLALL